MMFDEEAILLWVSLISLSNKRVKRNFAWYKIPLVHCVFVDAFSILVYIVDRFKFAVTYIQAYVDNFFLFDFNK